MACLTLIALTQVIGTPPRTERLENGLRVVIFEDHTLPLVSVQLWYRVGSAYDDPQNPGLCHVTRTILEHRDDAALRLRAAGARFESRTLRDACYFASVLPPNFLEYVLKIESGRMRPLKTTAETVATGLAAAARDFGLKPDDPEQLAERQLLAAMFPDHPYRHPPGLVAQSLSGLEPDDVDEFLQRWFVAGNATLLIIGDVSDVATMELVRRHFAPLPWAEPPRRAELPSPEAAQIHLPAVPAERAGVDIAWLTPPAGYFENAALDVLMHRLCNLVDGPLYLRLTEAGCRPPRWRREAWRDHGLLVLSVDWPEEEEENHEDTKARREGGSEPEASTRESPTEPEAQAREERRQKTGIQDEPRASARAAPPNASVPPALDTKSRDVERTIRTELTRAAETIPSEIELNRARALTAREVMLRRASFSKRALRLAWYEMVAGDLLLADFERPRVAAASVADVQEAAALLLRARTIVRPRQSSSEPEEKTAIPGVADLPSPLKAEPPTQLDSAAALDLLAQHAAGAPTVESRKYPFGVISRRLADGARITICPTPQLALADVRTVYVADGQLIDATGAIPAAGSTHHTSDQIQDYLLYHGLDLRPLARATKAGLASRGPVGRVPQMIELHGEILRYPSQASASNPPLAALQRLHEIHIIVCGDVKPDAVVEAAQLAWRGWQPAAERPLTTRPADWPRDAPIPTDTEWFTGLAPPELIIVEFLAPSAVPPAVTALADLCTDWCLGLPIDSQPSAMLDGVRAWRWRTRRLGRGSLQLSARPVPEPVVPAVTLCLERIGQLHGGRLSLDQVAMALRLARADRLLSLDNTTAIADLLETGVSEPWDQLDGLSANELLGIMRRARGVYGRLIAGRGPPDRAADLKRFESDPDSPQP